MTEAQANSDNETYGVKSLSATATPDDLAGKNSTVSNSSSVSSQEDSLDEQVNTAIDNARRTLNLLNSDYCAETRSHQNGSIVLTDASPGTDVTELHVNSVDPVSPDKVTPGSDISETVQHLMKALTKSQERIKQLTLKNMFLLQNLNELQSGFQVEQNLAKQQFESMKYNLVVQKTELQKQLENSTVKITKYRETIMSKNKEINRLARILNQTEVHSPISLRPSSVPSASVRKPYITRQLNSSDSNMLNTLGILATKVLKEEQNPSDHVTRAVSMNGIPQSNPSEKKPENLDNTESDISHDSTQLENHSAQYNSGIHNSASAIATPAPSVSATQQLPSLSAVSDIRSSSKSVANITAKFEGTELPVLNLNRPPLPNGTMLPKLRSFNTVDGTVRDVL